MSEVKKKEEYVTQSDFKTELKFIRADFKEALVSLKDKIQVLENLPRTILKTQVTMILLLGGFLFWLIDRDFEKIQLSIEQYNQQNQARLDRLEEINFTPTNQILLTKVNDFLDAYQKSQTGKDNNKDKDKTRKTKRGQ